MKSREAWRLHVSKSDGTLARMWLKIGDNQIPTAVIRFVLCCMPLWLARAPESRNRKDRISENDICEILSLNNAMDLLRLVLIFLLTSSYQL